MKNQLTKEQLTQRYQANLQCTRFNKARSLGSNVAYYNKREKKLIDSKTCSFAFILANQAVVKLKGLVTPFPLNHLAI